MKAGSRLFSENFAMFFLTGMLLIGSIRSFTKYTNLDLEKTSVASGDIIRAYEWDDGPRRKPERLFAFEVDGVGSAFGISKKIQEYSILARELRPDTFIKVYYLPSSSYINTNVLQIEKSGKILLGYKDVNQRHTDAGILMGFGAIGMLIFSFWYIRRRKRKLSLEEGEQLQFK